MTESLSSSLPVQNDHSPVIAGEGDILTTLEALLPQFCTMCRTFYRSHPQEAHPIAATGWMHRELISRFGAPVVLSHLQEIRKYLAKAKNDLLKQEQA